MFQCILLCKEMFPPTDTTRAGERLSEGVGFEKHQPGCIIFNRT